MGISGYSWLMLTLVWLLSFAANLMVLAPAPLLGAIMSELELTHSEAGLLVALPPLMYVLLSLVGGSLADRWCPKRVAGLGSLLMFVGGVVRGLAGSVDALFVFTAVAGAGVALTIPNLPKVISSWFPSDRIGIATGFYVTTFSIGPAVVFAATPTILLPILGSWRATLTFYGLFASAASILWWLLAKNRLVVVGSRSSFKEVLKVRDVWLLGFITTTANMLWYGVSGWLPYILVERGFDEATAGLVATLYTLTSVPALLLFPSASDRLGLRKPLISAPLLALGPIVYFLPQTYQPTIWLLSALFGILVSGVFSLMFIVPVERVGLVNAGGAMGLTLSIGYIGGLVGPWLVGYLRDLTGAFWSGFLSMAVVSEVALLLSLPLKETGGGGQPTFAQRRNSTI